MAEFEWVDALREQTDRIRDSDLDCIELAFEE
jgi:hypothetical protein